MTVSIGRQDVVVKKTLLSEFNMHSKARRFEGFARYAEFVMADKVPREWGFNLCSISVAYEETQESNLLFL